MNMNQNTNIFAQRLKSVGPFRRGITLLPLK